MDGSTTRFRLLDTPWGTMAIVARGRRLIGTLLPERSRTHLVAELSRRWSGAVPDNALLPALTRQIADYFGGRRSEFAVDCDLSGRTEFQKRVLAACRRIPAGRVVTYGELARRAGRPRAARAVGQAMASNPVPLVIPCHRVVAADGTMCGFSAAGGLDLKRRLLAHERRHYGSKK